MEPPIKELEDEDEELKELRAKESKVRGDQYSSRIYIVQKIFPRKWFLESI